MQTNRVCKTCGKKYFFCSNCDKNLNDPQWKLMWHDENCKNIFEIVSSFAQGQISKVIAREKLKKCNLKELNSFKDSIKTIVEEIIKEDKKVVQTEKKNVDEQLKKRAIPKRNRQQGKRN